MLEAMIGDVVAVALVAILAVDESMFMERSWRIVSRMEGNLVSACWSKLTMEALFDSEVDILVAT